MLPSPSRILSRIAAGASAGPAERAFGHAAPALRAAAWDLAVATVAEGLRRETTPSLRGATQLEQVGGLPNLIVELAGELAERERPRLPGGSPLALLAHAHACQREQLGVGPAEIVVELLTLRSVLWRFMTETLDFPDAADLLAAERRLSEIGERLAGECIAVYFERATSALAERARHDPLTRLLNLQAFQHELEVEIFRAERYGRELAVAYLDCDGFKRVNDRFGHPTGDRTLQELAKLIRETVRRSDLAARMGGDEFAVLLTEADFDAGARFLSRLERRVTELVRSGELPSGFAVSGGAAYYPRDGRSAAELLERADARLYERKQANKRGRRG